MVSKNTSVFGLSSDYLPLLVRCSEGQTPSIHDIHLNTLLSANNDVVSSAYDVALSDWSLDSPFPLCSMCLLFRNFGNVVLRVFPASHPFHLATISFVTRTRAMFSACPLVMGSFTSVMACASISRIGLKTSQGYTGSPSGEARVALPLHRLLRLCIRQLVRPLHGVSLPK